MTALRAALRPAIGPAPRIVLVTPELAERWLRGNMVNRPIREAKVNRYAHDMAEGRWTISESAICFSPTGRLLNGQHRLRAVIQSSRDVAMLILDGVPEKAMDNMDSGAKRTFSDVLRMEGASNAPLLSSTARLALVYTDGRIYKDRKVQDCSNAELAQFIDDNPLLHQSVAFASSVRTAIDLTPTAIGVGHWIFTEAADVADADGFFSLLASRIGLASGSPILALDSRIRELRRHNSKVTHRDELYMLVKTWNYWRKGHNVRVISYKSKNGDPRIPAVSR